MKKYDVIVIGAGHAGIEASFAAAKLGCCVLLCTLDADGVGKLSCNPAVGGVAKGHLVREVDALGGLLGKIADRSAVGYRRLNKSKGRAVWATRAQVDRFIYPKLAKSLLESEANIEIAQTEITNILTKNKHILGVVTNFGQALSAKTVIVCAGTFLKAKIHIGLSSFSGGRLCEPSSDKLFQAIKRLGFATKHFKTGTCARLDKRTIDFSNMVEQLPEYDVEPFSFFNSQTPRNQLSCFIAYTNRKTHRIIKRNLNKSPLYTGKIKAKGVRYCPSLEDKVVKFSHHERHQIFIEPEGRDSIEVYPNGISTSLPFGVQEEFIHSIEGLENACIIRPGYGIEHGVIDSCQFKATLESKLIAGFYFAGQVNGTTGYEEAAAQGLIAGINAALRVKRKKPFIISRQEAFIGVLIDDLTSKGTDEPYRMFTSRSEFRLRLRESNAIFRLFSFAYRLGLMNKEDYGKVLGEKDKIAKEIRRLKSTKVVFERKKHSLFDILKRPQTSLQDLRKFTSLCLTKYASQREVEIIAKYEGFLRRETAALKAFSNFRKIKIPAGLDFNAIPSLSREVRDKLSFHKPANLKQALEISGITPAAVLTVYNFIKRR